MVPVRTTVLRVAAPRILRPTRRRCAPGGGYARRVPQELDALPIWPEGTACVLATGGDAPHAIPVSTVLRAGDRGVVLGLSKKRESLQRLKDSPQVAVCLMAAGGVALTADGTATVLNDGLDDAPGMVAVKVDVTTIHDHSSDDFAIDDGVQWRWTDPDSDQRDKAARAELRKLT